MAFPKDDPPHHITKDREWYRRLVRINKEDFKAKPILKKLSAKILEYGGTIVAFQPDVYDRLLLQRGRYFHGAATMRRGKPCQCHANTAAMWKKNPDRVSIVTGYALSDDGVWRCHTWGLSKSGTVYETTVARDGYFGVVLTPQEAKRFHLSNPLAESL